MSLPTLYPAQVGSPYTTLAATYTTGATTMTLADATKLPDAPNIVCLSGSVAGEFSYAGKDGNILQGVVALPGTPSTTWAIGTYAFRGIAAYDQNSVREHLLALSGVSVLPPTFSGADATEQFEAAQAAAEAVGLPIHIPADMTGDLDYDPTAIAVDVYDDRLSPGRTLGLIPPIQTDLSSLRHRPSLKMVVTGDSLSYNRYDFDDTARTTAEDGKYGYKSWAYLIRDAFLRNLPGWCGESDFLIGSASTATAKTEAGGFADCYIPLDGRRLGAGFAVGQILDLYIPPSVLSGVDPSSVGALYLYFMTVPAVNAGSFTATVYNAVTGAQIGDPVSFSSEGDGTYLDYALRSVCLGTAIPSYSPIRVRILLNARVGAGPGVLSILGSAATEFSWTHTGRGSTTSEWLATNVATLITNYSPDIVLITTGANDIGGGLTEAETYANIRAVVEATRAANPYTEIVLVTQPPSSTRPDDQSLARCRAVRRVAAQLDCGYIDAFSVLRRTDPAYWRYDNVHLTREGSQIMFEAIASAFFPALDITLCNQRNRQGGAGYYSEQTPRNALWRWRPYLPVEITATYAAATGRISATTALDSWAGVYTAPAIRLSAPTLLNGSDAASDLIRIAENGGRVEVTLQNPFSMSHLSPRLVPSPVLIDDGTNEPIILIEVSRSGSATVYSAWTWADVVETDSGSDTVTVRELVQITSLSDVPDGAALRLSFLL